MGVQKIPRKKGGKAFEWTQQNVQNLLICLSPQVLLPQLVRAGGGGRISDSGIYVGCGRGQVSRNVKEEGRFM